MHHSPYHSPHLHGRATLLAPPQQPINRETVARSFLTMVAVLLLMDAPAWSDIEVKPQYNANEQITVQVVPTGVPVGALLRGSFQVAGAQWDTVTVPNAAELRASAAELRALAATLEPDKAPAVMKAALEIEKAIGTEVYHVWAGSGSHEITASGIWVLTDTGTLGGKLLDFGMYQYKRTFQVGPEVPIVPPPPPPNPGGPYQILLLYDADTKDNLPPSQLAILTSLAYRQKLQAAGHRVLAVIAAQSIADPEVSKFAAFFRAAKNVPLPCLVVAAVEGGQVAALPLPTDEAALNKLLATELVK